MEIPEHFTELSMRFSEVLDDSGAGKETVLERRKTYLWRERMVIMIDEKLLGGDTMNVECFHFGSQTEGTTIPGLQSDIDILCSNHNVNIMTVLGDWKARKDMNLLMLYDETMPLQQYLLQVIRDHTEVPVTNPWDDYSIEVIKLNTPSPETSLWYHNFVRKESDVVLYSAERFKQDHRSQLWNRGSDIAIFNGPSVGWGPSVSWVPSWDIVQAFHVLKPIPEIQHWIDRCRGKPWPPVQVLEAARVAPCFLLPAGHTDSDYKPEQWRLSPNLIERMLMFSFNMTQIKCYIVLKLIKKSLFANIVGDSITSFHCKTIIFYTIDRTRPSLWVEHNLMFLLRLCLNVLRQCLRCGRLPHYIIEGVNLFDGKLSKLKQRHLFVYVDSMIKNNLQDVFYIGHIHAAVRVLEDVDRWFHSMTRAVCGCRYLDKNHDLHQFANMLSRNSDKVFVELPFAFCVSFCRRESYCTPCILLFEMYRNITEEEVALQNYVDKKWMVSAEVDARSFLHYLRYLTYGALGDHGNQENALRQLVSCIYDKTNTINQYHTETTLNLLGHCYEMEGLYEFALYLYEKSLHHRSTNNAANWHVRRVRRLLKIRKN